MCHQVCCHVVLLMQTTTAQNRGCVVDGYIFNNIHCCCYFLHGYSCAHHEVEGLLTGLSQSFLARKQAAHVLTCLGALQQYCTGVTCPEKTLTACVQLVKKKHSACVQLVSRHTLNREKHKHKVG